MAFAEHEVLIRCDAMTVYAFLVDGTNLPQWRQGIRSIALMSGAAGTKGAVYRQTITGRSGRTIPADFEITHARPGAEIQFRVISGPSQPSGGYYLSTRTGRHPCQIRPRIPAQRPPGPDEHRHPAHH